MWTIKQMWIYESTNFAREETVKAEILLQMEKEADSGLDADD